jgi:hypothetical protein
MFRRQQRRCRKFFLAQTQQHGSQTNTHHGVGFWFRNRGNRQIVVVITRQLGAGENAAIQRQLVNTGSQRGLVKEDQVEVW